MLKVNVGKKRATCCNGVTRRHALRLGASGLISGLTLPQLLELQAKAAGPQPLKAKACIFIFLEGGPPHQDMWDPKPEAPEEIRGPFQAIQTSVPGTWVTDQLPRCAAIADKYTILRSHSHTVNGHSTGYHYVMTGHKPTFADGLNPVPFNEFYPSIGSIVSRELKSGGALPKYINVPHLMGAGGPGFYGAEHAPFVIEADPSQADFKVKDLQPTSRLSEKRLSVRQKLLADIDRRNRNRDQGVAGTMSTYYEKAYDLITSPEAKRAFDIQSEPASVREAYGYTQLGQCTLLARRMVEAGCRFVGIDAPGWDVHFNCFPSLRTDLIPHLDCAFSALVNDLDQRGILDDTLVIVMGEMGRTPRVNVSAGRDHWSMAQSVVFAGGGIKPGQVIGATDKHAAAPTSNPVGVNDILRTISVLMGIDPDRMYYDPLGRPVPIVNGGKIIPQLI
ncbi:MAG: DUF1501 domain-containing protein [Pirellulales bacterium]|nr:DUF1501 domain-containing protein [Pirellulales bacterium]